MNQIFVCGNSGTGKSTFCESVTELRTDLIYVKEVIRRLNVKSQLSYLLAYNDIHKMDNIISDRSIIDVIVFNKYNPDVLTYIKNTFKKPDLIVVTPNLKLNFIKKNIGIWLNDKLRIDSYSKNWNFDWKKDPDLLPSILYNRFTSDYNLMISYLKILEWNYKEFNHVEEYFDWQHEAMNMIYKNR